MTLPDSEITIPAYPSFLLRVETRNLLTLRLDSTRMEDLIWDLVACIGLVLVQGDVFVEGVQLKLVRYLS